MKRRIVLYFLIALLMGFLWYFAIYSTAFLKLFFNEKIWVHRTNSVEKLNEVSPNFYGVELDIMFVDSINNFDVNHPPAASINLSLESYLNSSNQKKNLHYWLDFKNLSLENQEKSLNKLIEICEKYKLNNSNFIVESMNIQALSIFSEKGFWISYYLNWPGLFMMNEKNRAEEIKKIKKNLSFCKSPVFLSSDYRDYEILNSYFPNYEKLFWLDGDFNAQNKLKQRLKLCTILSNKTTKVLLIKYNSVYER